MPYTSSFLNITAEWLIWCFVGFPRYHPKDLSDSSLSKRASITSPTYVVCYVSSSQHKPFAIGYLYYPIPTTSRLKDRTNDVKYPLHLILWAFQVFPAHLNKSELYTGVVFVLFDKSFSSFPKNVKKACLLAILEDVGNTIGIEPTFKLCRWVLLTLY